MTANDEVGTGMIAVLQEKLLCEVSNFVGTHCIHCVEDINDVVERIYQRILGYNMDGFLLTSHMWNRLDLIRHAAHDEMQRGLWV